MLLIPYAYLRMHSSLAPEQVAQTLINEVPPDCGDRTWSNTTQSYFGSVWENSFLFIHNLNQGNLQYPLIFRRSPFLPVMSGKVKSNGSGADITVNVTLPLQTALVIGFFILFFLAWIIFVVEKMIAQSAFDEGFLVPMMLLIGLYTALMWRFEGEVKAFKQFLERVIKASE